MPVLLHSVAEICPVLKEKGIRSVLMVTDGGLRGGGVTKSAEDCLTDAGIRLAVYDKTRANPTVQNVEEAFSLYRSENCQALIAFGGGSSMDCAKAVGARVAYQPYRRRFYGKLLRLFLR